MGRNGSGKSTLLKIVAGKVEPDSGDKFVQPGITIEYLPQEPDLSGFRDVYSYTVEKQNTAIAKHTASYLLQQFGIKEDRQLDNLSGGETRKAALAKVLAPKPDILLLDEPTGGLDVTSARMVRKLVRKLGDEGGTVIYSTHNLAEAEQVCDRIVIIHNGTIRADGNPSELIEGTNCENLEEAYVALSEDDARTETTEDEGKFARAWRKLVTRKGGQNE